MNVAAVLLPSEISVIRTEAHTERTGPGLRGVTPAGVHAEIRAAEPAKVMVHADETHSAWAKNDPLSSDF